MSARSILKQEQEQWIRHTAFSEPDPEIEAKRLATDLRLRSAGPMFLNDEGESVGFDDLDFGRQVGLLMAYTFPIDPPEDVRAYKRRMELVPVGDGKVGQRLGDGVSRIDGSLARRKEQRSDSGIDDGQRLASPKAPPRRNRGPDAPLPTPYELVACTDDTLTTIRRRQPSIERNWHHSKSRQTLSQELLEEAGGEWGVYTKAAMCFGPKGQAGRRSV